MRTHKQNSITCNIRDEQTFTLVCVLKHKVDAEQHARDKTLAMDVWQCSLQGEYPETMEFEFRQGMGYRKYKPGKKPDHKPERTIYDFECLDAAIPQKPDIESVLISLGSDYMTARDMPRQLKHAVQYLMDEFGSDNAVQTIETVEALQENADKFETLLRQSGIPADEFAEWCMSLDC